MKAQCKQIWTFVLGNRQLFNIYIKCKYFMLVSPEFLELKSPETISKDIYHFKASRVNHDLE